MPASLARWRLELACHREQILRGCRAGGPRGHWAGARLVPAQPDASVAAELFTRAGTCPGASRVQVGYWAPECQDMGAETLARPSGQTSCLLVFVGRRRIQLLGVVICRAAPRSSARLCLGCRELLLLPNGGGGWGSAWRQLLARRLVWPERSSNKLLLLLLSLLLLHRRGSLCINRAMKDRSLRQYSRSSSLEQVLCAQLKKFSDACSSCVHQMGFAITRKSWIIECQ